jgi:GNAT superfamily N-acetyltransferase
MNQPIVRKAVREDADTLFRLIDALAAYEHLVPPTAEAKVRLVRDMFSAKPRIEPYLCEIGGVAAGYALVLETYSSFLALPTLYLEDIFVLPEFRNHKAGAALFLAMAKEAHERGCGRMEWTVLDWNSLAIQFYKRFDAAHMKEWQLFRLTQQQLAVLSGAGLPEEHELPPTV